MIEKAPAAARPSLLWACPRSMDWMMSVSKPRARHTATVKVPAERPKHADIDHTKLLGIGFLMSLYRRDGLLLVRT
jgi:hypothetical protein